MSVLSYRELYAPAHFGNSYEVAADYEIEEWLREAVLWGFNSYGDWFDAADLKNPLNNPRCEFLTPQATWERKKSSYRIASRLGLQTTWLVTPNHVFIDQLSPDVAADFSGDERMFGQLVCPSTSGGRKVILETQKALLQDLKDAGAHMDYISGCPYDYGGCTCQQCTPWIIAFGKLMVDLHEVAREVFPDIRVRLIGWWWTLEEHELFKAWANAEQPGRFVSLAEHIRYDETHPIPGIVLPDGCEPQAFVHIGYNNERANDDVYGIWGPVVAPARIEQTVRNLETTGFGGFVAYSEGASDDVNKALLAGLSSGKFASSGDVLAAYAERYFGSVGAEREAWAEWLAAWGESQSVDLAAARKEFDSLARRARSGWRLDQWECRLRLSEAHSQVTKQPEWNDAADAAAAQFVTERDRMYREVWKLGLVRHVLNYRFSQPAWYARYQSPHGEFGRSSEM
jgi:hypothetical protein